MKPTHPTLIRAQLPRLIPAKDFVDDRKFKSKFKISPHGDKIAWLEKDAICIQKLDSSLADKIKVSLYPDIETIVWAKDNRHIIVYREYHYIYVFDSDNPDNKPVDLKSDPDVGIILVGFLPGDEKNILIGLSKGIGWIFDLYKVNITTGKQLLMHQNPGDVRTWKTDYNGSFIGRIREAVEKDSTFEIWQEKDKKWIQKYSWNVNESVSFIKTTSDKKGLWILSNKGRDLKVLSVLDLTTGQEKVEYEAENIDVRHALISNKSKMPVLAFSYPDRQKVKVFDEILASNLADELNDVFDSQPYAFTITSWDNAEKKYVLLAYTAKEVRYYLYQKPSNQLAELYSYPAKKYVKSFSDTVPVAFTSKDGLTINGYITIPNGSNGKNLPMVLNVHGGPWSRDYWRYNNEIQFLANRGYAVLQINFRGSAGYGKAFEMAARGEFAGKMHNDLLDGVQWAIKKGIADPKKICIMGGSYGGYAALVGLAFTPEIFACGVDMFGISNLVTANESKPIANYAWHKKWPEYVGDSTDPEDRIDMEKRSPLFKADKINRPLLIVHGGNDSVVLKNESDQIVRILKKQKKDVEYLVFPDEAHGFENGRNLLRFLKKLERFLGKHLGGRYAVD